MNARNARSQVLVVLTALMMLCSSGAMVVGAAPGTTVDEQTTGEESTVETQAQAAVQVQENDTTDGGDEPIELEPDQGDGDDGDGDGEQPAYVTFEEQSTQGQTVVVDEVTMANGGFVVIHDSSLLVEDVFGSVIGTSTYLEAGTHENVEITLDEPLEEDEDLIAMPHRDTNDNQQYDFVEQEGQADTPYLAGGEPVTDRATVTVEETQQPVDEEPNETDDGPDGEQPQQPIGEEPNETDDQPGEQPEQPVDEPNETDGQPGEQPEQPVDEPNETDDQPSEQPEQPVEEEPEEPAEEEPEQPLEPDQPVEEPEDEGPAIEVVIEEATIFAVVGADETETADEEPGTDGNGAGDIGDDDSTIDGIENESEPSGDESDAHRESGLGMSAQQVEITIEQVNVTPIGDQPGLPSTGDGVDDETDGIDGGVDNETADSGTGTDTVGETDGDNVSSDGAHAVTIGDATVFVVVEDGQPMDGAMDGQMGNETDGAHTVTVSQATIFVLAENLETGDDPETIDGDNETDETIDGDNETDTIENGTGGVDDVDNVTETEPDTGAVEAGHQVTIEQATIAVVHEQQPHEDNATTEQETIGETDDTDENYPLENDGAAETDSLEEDETAAENGLEDGGAADTTETAASDGPIDVTIERATVFVLVEGVDEAPIDGAPEMPVEEEPVEPVEPEEPDIDAPEEPDVDQPEEPDIEEPEEPAAPDEPDVGDEPIDGEPDEEPGAETPDGDEEPAEEVPDEPAEEAPDGVNETPVQEPTEPFLVDNLTAPETAAIGETITVTATVSNPADAEATQEIQFRIQGDLIESQNVTLAGGESQEVTFEIDTSGFDAGNYVHMVLTDATGEVAFIELTADGDTETAATDTATDDGIATGTDVDGDNESAELPNETADENETLVGFVGPA